MTKIANQYIPIDEKISPLLEKINSLFDEPITHGSCQDFGDQGYCDILFSVESMKIFTKKIAEKSIENNSYDFLYYLINNKAGSKLENSFHHRIFKDAIRMKIAKKRKNLRNNIIKDNREIYYIGSFVRWQFNPNLIPSIVESFDAINQP